MKHRPLVVAAASSAVTALVCVGAFRGATTSAAPPAAPPPVSTAPAADPAAQLAALQEQVKALQALVPDQAAVMSHVGYHFANLWVAIERENWPLADFYLSEARSNIKWAVRAKPLRKNAGGEPVDLAAIAAAIDGGPLAELKKAIAEKSKPRASAAYDQSLEGCYACHKASSKPYLRPQRPASAEAPVINFDPNATTPP